MKFKYEKETYDLPTIAAEGGEDKEPEFPKVYIRLPDEIMEGLTIGKRVRVTVEGELCAVNMDDYRKEIGIYAETGSIEPASKNEFADLADDSDEYEE